jgi:hypothetical protein
MDRDIWEHSNTKTQLINIVHMRKNTEGALYKQWKHSKNESHGGRTECGNLPDAPFLPDWHGSTVVLKQA